MAVERDGWDWLLYAVSLGAAGVAIMAFGSWLLEQRRRPEFRLVWRYASGPEPSKPQGWPPDHVPVVEPGGTLLIEVAMCNVGDKTAVDFRANLFAPDCLELRRPGDDTPAMDATDDTAGLPPDHRVVFFSTQHLLAPGNWLQDRYRLTARLRPSHEALAARLLFVVADIRLNSTGRRWLPSLLPPAESIGAPVGSAWPPALRRHRHLRRVHAEPADHVVTGPSFRCDARDIIFHTDVDPRT